MAMDLVLAEPVEREDVGDVTQRVGQVGDEVAYERDRQAAAAARQQRLAERVRLPGAGAGDDQLLIRARREDRLESIGAILCLPLEPPLLGSHARGCS